MSKTKRNRLIIVSLFFLVIEIVFSFSPYHVARNKNNLLPKGNLTLVKDYIYLDENSLWWELQPHYKNVFHQPEKGLINIEDIWYPNVNPTIVGDIEYPNLKFLSEDGWASHEVILQPDGQFLLNGKQQGTYNYAHPSSIFGNIAHVFVDVIPHFINSNYEE